RRDHREDRPAKDVEQVDVLLAYELRERLLRNPLAEDAEASWVLHPTPDRGQLRDVGAEHLTTPFRQRTSTGRPVNNRDFVECDLVSSEVRGQRDVVF